MGNNSFLLRIMAAVFFALAACSGAKKPEFTIKDLNGTWMPNRMFGESYQVEEGEIEYSQDEFSWGLGKTRRDVTFAVDITAASPVFFAPAMGIFKAIQIRKTGRDTIAMVGHRGMDGSDASWEFPIEFRFIDKDTIGITCEALGEDSNITKDVLWRRISGP
jgi:hypothetical protein